MDKITIERETLQADIVERLRAMSFVICGEAANEIERLRAALAQQAEPVEQEAALQKIADFGQEQVMTPDVLISKLANLRLMAAARHVPEVDLVTIDLAIEHLRYFSATPLQRLSDARMDGIYNAWRDMGDDVSYGDLMRMVEAEIQGGK